MCASVSSPGNGKLPGRRYGLFRADRRTATEVASGTTLVPIAAAGRQPPLTVSEVVDPVERFGPFLSATPTSVMLNRRASFEMPPARLGRPANTPPEKSSNTKAKPSEASPWGKSVGKRDNRASLTMSFLERLCGTRGLAYFVIFWMSTLKWLYLIISPSVEPLNLCRSRG